MIPGGRWLTWTKLCRYVIHLMKLKWRAWVAGCSYYELLQCQWWSNDNRIMCNQIPCVRWIKNKKRWLDWGIDNNRKLPHLGNVMLVCLRTSMMRAEWKNPGNRSCVCICCSRPMHAWMWNVDGCPKKVSNFWDLRCSCWLWLAAWFVRPQKLLYVFTDSLTWPLWPTKLCPRAAGCWGDCDWTLVWWHRKALHEWGLHGMIKQSASIQHTTMCGAGDWGWSVWGCLWMV